jgi:hypothetical protein
MSEAAAGNILSELNKIREGVESQSAAHAVFTGEPEEPAVEGHSEILNEIYRLRSDVGAGTDYELLAEILAFKEEMRSSRADSDAAIKAEINALREELRILIAETETDASAEPADGGYAAYDVPPHGNAEVLEVVGLLRTEISGIKDEIVKLREQGVSAVLDEKALDGVNAEIGALQEEVRELREIEAAADADFDSINNGMDELRAEMLIQKSDTDNHVIIENNGFRAQLAEMGKKVLEVEDKLDSALSKEGETPAE